MSQVHEKALALDEAIHTAAAESARHEALFWQWMESVVDERDAGGRAGHSKPAPHDEGISRYPTETDLAELACELDLTIEDWKRDCKVGVREGSESDIDHGSEVAERIRETERWLRERGWESYDALLERVLERAEVSGEPNVGPNS